MPWGIHWNTWPCVSLVGAACSIKPTRSFLAVVPSPSSFPLRACSPLIQVIPLSNSHPLCPQPPAPTALLPVSTSWTTLDTAYKRCGVGCVFLRVLISLGKMCSMFVCENLLPFQDQAIFHCTDLIHVGCFYHLALLNSIATNISVLDTHLSQ